MLFYLADPNNQIQTGQIFEHLKSHRLEEGRIFFATDLKGFLFECRLLKIDKKKQTATIQTLNKTKQHNDADKILVQAIPDKLYLEKLVELSTMAGFAEIWLFPSQFSPKYNVNYDRLEKISLQASLLTERTYPCLIRQVIYTDLLQQAEIISQSAILERQEIRVEHPLDLTINPNYVWVGPEGGWSESELATFRNLSIPFISLTDSKTYPAWLAGSAWKFRIF